MVNDIEKEYNKLSKKFNLPKFKDIDIEFEISALESHNFLLRNILRRMEEKLQFYIEVIGNLVHPDASSLSTMYEVRYFSESEKNVMYMMFKKMMKADRIMIGLILSSDEKKQADFLNSFLKEWMDLKKDLLDFLDKMKDSWEKESTIEEDLGYFG